MEEKNFGKGKMIVGIIVACRIVLAALMLYISILLKSNYVVLFLIAVVLLLTLGMTGGNKKARIIAGVVSAVWALICFREILAAMGVVESMVYGIFEVVLSIFTCLSLFFSKDVNAYLDNVLEANNIRYGVKQNEK